MVQRKSLHINNLTICTICTITIYYDRKLRVYRCCRTICRLVLGGSSRSGANGADGAQLDKRLKIGGIMSVLGSMVQAIGNVSSGPVASVTKSQTTVTKMVRVDVGAEESGEVVIRSTTSSPAWPSLTLYDDAQVLRAKFLDLIATKTIYSLSVTHLTHFDQAWRSRSISRLREVYWEVLKRWCSEETSRYTYTHRPATVVRYDRWKKVAVVEEVEGSADNPLASVSRVV